MANRPPKNPTEINRRFWGVGGQTIGLDTEPWYPPTGTEISPMTDTPVTESQHPPTSARKGVTERITAMDTTTLSSASLGAAPQNASRNPEAEARAKEAAEKRAADKAVKDAAEKKAAEGDK